MTCHVTNHENSCDRSNTAYLWQTSETTEHWRTTAQLWRNLAYLWLHMPSRYAGVNCIALTSITRQLQLSLSRVILNLTLQHTPANLRVWISETIQQQLCALYARLLWLSNFRPWYEPEMKINLCIYLFIYSSLLTFSGILIGYIILLPPEVVFS